MVTKSQKRCPSVKLKPLDYGDGEKAHLTPSAKYRIGCFLPVIDKLVTLLDYRQQAYAEIVLCFRFLSTSRVWWMVDVEIRISADILISAYPTDIDIAIF